MHHDGPEIAELRIRGDFFSTHSFARVNRELTRALLRRDDVSVVPLAEPTDAAFAALGLQPSRNEQRRPHANTFTLRHAWPPRFMRPAQGRYIHMQTTEFGAIPRAWIADSVAHCDDIWCISSYMRTLYLEAGVPAERLAMIPHGVSPDIHSPDGPTLDLGLGDAFVFLFVGAALHRKGIDILTAAYRAEFRGDEDVVLLIKESAVGLDDDRDGVRRTILSLTRMPGVAKILYTGDDIEDETMAALYRSADALVHPYRGEGFALPVLEAMACGLPVIATAGGATDDFVRQDLAYRIRSERRASRDPDGFDLGGRGWLLEPDVRDLMRLMREVYNRRRGARLRALQASAEIRAHWSWDDAARVAVDRLRMLSYRDGESAPSLSVGAPPETLSTYASRVSSRNGEDGMLHELFARIGVARPFFAEDGVEDIECCNTAYFARVLGWSGYLGVRDAGAEASLAYALREFPSVTVADVSADAGAFARGLLACRPSGDIDLLIVDAKTADAARLIEIMRPRVLLAPETSLREAWSAGYVVLLAGGPSITAILVRRDLVALAGFAKHASVAVT